MSTTTLRAPGGFWASTRKVLTVARLHALQQLVYPGQVFASCIFAAVILYTLSVLWRTIETHHDVRALTGFGLRELVWYLAFSEALAMTYGIPWDGLAIDKEIRSGDVVYRLARPQAYPLYHLGAILGERLSSVALRLPLHACIAWVLVGWPSFTPAGIALAVATGLLAGVADLAWVLAISLTSFWVEDTFGLHFMYRRCMYLLGGLLIPLEAYPEWLRRIAQALPFKAILYGPARQLLQTDAWAAWPLVRLQLMYAASGFVVGALIYRAGVRRVSAQGG